MMNFKMKMKDIFYEIQLLLNVWYGFEACSFFSECSERIAEGVYDKRPYKNENKYEFRKFLHKK